MSNDTSTLTATHAERTVFKYRMIGADRILVLKLEQGRVSSFRLVETKR